MKTILIKTRISACVLIAGLITMGQSTLAKDATAFDLIKEGNRYVGDQSKDKVVQVRSEKSLGSLTPDIWYVVYYDPDAVLKAVEVKFSAGRKVDVTRPLRLLEPIIKADEPMPKNKLKVDSDKALDIASKESLLEKITLKASRLVLERRGYEDAMPVWKIRLWAAKVRDPNDHAEIGEIIISAEDGKVLKSDLKPEYVN